MREKNGDPDAAGEACTRPDRHLRIVHSEDKSAGVSLVGAPESGKRAVMLDRGVQARIGSLLRAAFDDIAQAPMPDRFVALLDALENKKDHSEG